MEQTIDHRRGARIRLNPGVVPDLVTRSLVFLFLLFLIGGCTVEKKPISVAIPATFSQSGTEAFSSRWWEEFADPELDALMEEALSGNFDLKMAWDRLDQVAAVLGISSAALWPQVQAEFELQQFESQGDTASAQTGGSQTAGYGYFEGTSYSLSFAASYELDLWGRVRAARKAAGQDLFATREDLESLAMTVSGSVALLWYEVNEKRLQRSLLEEQMRTNETYLGLLESRFQKGLTSAAAVLQQRQQLVATRGELPLVSSRITVLEHQLALLVGRSPLDGPIEQVASLPELPGLPQTGIPGELVLRRPDIRAAQLRLDAAENRVVEARANRLPRLSVTASASDQEEKISDLFDSWFSNLVVNLAGPLFDGSRLKRGEDRTRAVVSERLHALEKAILTAFSEVEDALSLEYHQQLYCVNLEEQVDLAGKTFQVTKQRFLNGDTDYLPVLTSLQTLQRLERQRLESQRVLLSHRINVYRALGGGFQLQREPDIMDNGATSRRKSCKKGPFQKRYP